MLKQPSPHCPSAAIPEDPSPNNTLLLMEAVETGSVDTVRTLLQNGTNPNITSIISSSSGGGSTPLILAVSQQSHALVLSLLEHGANANAVSRNGLHALHVAVFNGHLAIINTLLASGADVEGVDETDDTTPLMSAALTGNVEVARRLVDHGANVNGCNSVGTTALIVAAQNKQLDVVKFLIQCGANVNATAKGQQTALTIAANEGHLKVMRLLLQNRTDIYAGGDRGATAMYVAADEEHLPVMTMLLQQGMNVNGVVEEESESSALLCAAFSNRPRAVQLLLEYGADPNFADNAGYTALLLSVEAGQGEGIPLALLEHGAETNMACDTGKTPLITAAEDGDEHLVLSLLQMDAMRCEFII